MATIKIKQIKSRIGAPVDQKRTLIALGLHKISQVVEVEDTPSNRSSLLASIRFLRWSRLKILLATVA